MKLKEIVNLLSIGAYSIYDDCGDFDKLRKILFLAFPKDNFEKENPPYEFEKNNHYGRSRQNHEIWSDTGEYLLKLNVVLLSKITDEFPEITLKPKKKTKSGLIDKSTFCEVIENLRQQLYLDRKYGEYIEEMFGSKTQCTYNDSLLAKSIVKLLQVHFPKDETGFCHIEHYCFCIEFGRVENQELITAEDLYDELISKTHK